MLVDVDTGKVLLAQNDHALLPPGSLTKMLTAMIAVDWLPADAVVPVSARAATVAPDRVGMKAGQRWSLNIAMHTLLISSANDAAYALAERVSGTVERFAATMTYAATQIGITDRPVLRDPAGLDGKEGAEGGNLISAWDLAIAGRDLMANPALAAIVGMKKFRFTGPDHVVYELSSHNLAFLNSYVGAIGVKTGFTDRAGVCVVEEAVRNGRHMMAVVMNGVSPDMTAGMLLDQGFAIPVAAEPAKAPMLPPIREPRPPPRPVPVTVPSRQILNLEHRLSSGAQVVSGGPGLVHAAAAPVATPRAEPDAAPVAAASTPAPSSGMNPWALAGLSALALVVGSLLVRAIRVGRTARRPGLRFRRR